MQFRFALAIAGLGLSLAACNAVTATSVADVACLGAEMGSAVAVVAATDANIGSNGSKRATQAQIIAKAVQKAVGDTCPLIATGVDAIATATARSGSAK
jgi:hypothetical protein